MELIDRHGNILQVKSLSSLDNAIKELKVKRKFQEDAIENAFFEIKENLRPVNLLKSAVHKITDNKSPLELGLKIAGTVGAALLAKKAFSHKKDKNNELLFTQPNHEESTPIGNLLRGMVANYIVSHVPNVAAYGTAIVKNLFLSKEKEEIENTDV